METIVNFLHEWAIPGLLLCILMEGRLSMFLCNTIKV